MAKLNIRGKIAIQTNHVMIVRPATQPVVRWCAKCERESPMLVPEEAALYWGASVRAVYRGIEAGTVHYLEVSGGVLVCLDS